MTMKKNSTVQNVLPSKVMMPDGYATNKRPGPAAATSSTFLPCVLAMYPINEKTTNPANMLVPESMQQIEKACLKIFIFRAQ